MVRDKVVLIKRLLPMFVKQNYKKTEEERTHLTSEICTCKSNKLHSQIPPR